MREYFRGWKRKTGCLTLALACVFMAGWVRSHSVHDALVIPTGKHSSIQIISACRCFVLLAAGITGSTPNTFEYTWQSKPCQHNRTMLRIETCLRTPAQSLSRRIETGIEINGILPSAGDFRLDDVSASYYGISYWYLILPMTLVSAYLLLSKPRPKKPG